jgi:ribosomal protein L11 methyltransferase
MDRDMDRRTSWREIQIEVDAQAAELVGAAVADIADGIELRDAETVIRTAPNRALVIAHVAPQDREDVLAVIHAAAIEIREAGLSIDPIVIRERDAHEDEWRDVWKQFFRATRVGRSFIVRPSWDPGSIVPGDHVIDLDPGRAFGTGGHASTRLVIFLLENLAETLAADGKIAPRFLDLGCGSGILSIAAARLWPQGIGLAVDIDPEAVECARENLDRNHIGSVAVATGTLDGVVPAEPPFDVILANIQADVLGALAPVLPSRLVDDGRLILSGLLLRDAEPVFGLFKAAGFHRVRRQDDGDWAALELRLGARS